MNFNFVFLYKATHASPFQLMIFRNIEMSNKRKFFLKNILIKKNDVVLTCRSVWAISVLFSLQKHISPSLKPGLKSWSSLLHYFYLQSKINIIWRRKKTKNCTKLSWKLLLYYLFLRFFFCTGQTYTLWYTKSSQSSEL